MFKYKVIAFVLLTAVFMSGRAYCQEARAASGLVTDIDVEAGVINVQTENGNMMFYLLTESNLYRSNHHISSIEIEKNDPVKIRYVSTYGKNDIVSLVDNKPAG